VVKKILVNPESAGWFNQYFNLPAGEAGHPVIHSITFPERPDLPLLYLIRIELNNPDCPGFVTYNGWN
jgi:hypothetical protein